MSDKKLSLNLKGITDKEAISKRALNAFIKNTPLTNAQTSKKQFGENSACGTNKEDSDLLNLTKQEELNRIRALREYQKQTNANQETHNQPVQQLQETERKGAKIFESIKGSKEDAAAYAVSVTPIEKNEQIAPNPKPTLDVNVLVPEPEMQKQQQPKEGIYTQKPQETINKYKPQDRSAASDNLRLSSRSSFSRHDNFQKRKRKPEPTNLKRGKVIVIEKKFVTARDLSVILSEPKRRLLGCLKSLGESVDEDAFLKREVVEMIALELGHTIKYKVSQADLIGVEEKRPVDNKDLKERPPVVTIMGHIDHGKTTLLDAFRQSAVVDMESGGITQHIGAYQIVTKSGKNITFIDTPGHAAFTAMRMRGAKVTDIVILIVAADDGVNEQTIEAIKHAKAAQVPIIVAINKIDKSAANPQKVMTSLIQHDIIVEEMGGDIISVNISAKEKINLDKLEEAILLEAEFLELKYDPKRRAEGVVIESKLDKRCGAFATLLVKDGKLETGQTIVVGESCGKIKGMQDSWGKKIKSAPAGMPVEVLGLDIAPPPGSEFFVVKNEKEAKVVLDAQLRNKETTERVARDYFAEERLKLNFIIKADVNGSIEAIIESLKLLDHDEVEMKIVHSGVGDVNESDVLLAQVSDAYIIGFRVKADKKVKENEKIIFHSIIYEVIEGVKLLIKKMTTPETRENSLGFAEVKEIFTLSDKSKIAGCYVKSGVIQKSSKVKLLRNSKFIKESTIKALRYFKDDVKEVKANHECGILLASFDDIKVGDVIEAFEIVVNRE